jgi:uncharacterized protein YjbI with pentapeptide repeats
MTFPRNRALEASLLYTFRGRVGDDEDLCLALLGADVIIDGRGSSLQQCALSLSMIRNAEGIQVRGCRWQTVDAANAELDRSGWRDSEIVGSRMTGARINSAHLGKCRFVACKMHLLQCQLSTLIDVRFEQCDLRGAYFNGSAMSGTVFEGSDLTGADFSGATITGCDFRRATIDDIRVAPEQMSGVIVTSDQALYLARLFGLDIQE